MIDRSSRQCIEHKPLEESQEEYEETSFACVQACVRHNPSREQGPFFPDSDVGNVADCLVRFPNCHEKFPTI